MGCFQQTLIDQCKIWFIISVMILLFHLFFSGIYGLLTGYATVENSQTNFLFACGIMFWEILKGIYSIFRACTLIYIVQMLCLVTFTTIMFDLYLCLKFLITTYLFPQKPVESASEKGRVWSKSESIFSKYLFCSMLKKWFVPKIIYLKCIIF